jgi:hypothetical protein
VHPTLRTFRTGGAIVVALLAVSCSDDGLSPVPADSGPTSLAAAAPAPGLLVPVPAGTGSLSIWPYTGVDFSGTPQDPINLVFTGQADPRAIRAALMALNGDRTGFGMPSLYPFNCTWSDAIGDLQTGYNGAKGWVGSAIQLACGNYGPVRFHVRLFEGGVATVGNAHFEVLIPGTTDHQVLSWERAQELVTVDLMRSGLLDPTDPLGITGSINDAPFRTIPEPIYNGIPSDLKTYINGPAGSVSAPVPIRSTGYATVFHLTGDAPEGTGSEQSFVINFGQVIPRPFCASGPEFLFVQGPVSLRKTVQLRGHGDLVSEFDASGRLRLTPVDPSTGAPAGSTYDAEVSDHQETRFDDRGGRAEGLQVQTELPRNVSGHGQRVIRLKVGVRGADKYKLDIDCRPARR